jgi:hypothetical protein
VETIESFNAAVKLKAYQETAKRVASEKAPPPGLRVEYFGPSMTDVLITEGAEIAQGSGDVLGSAKTINGTLVEAGLPPGYVSRIIDGITCLQSAGPEDCGLEVESEEPEEEVEDAEGLDDAEGSAGADGDSAFVDGGEEEPAFSSVSDGGGEIDTNGATPEID